SAQRPARREPKLRKADSALRHQVQGLRSLPLAGERAAQAREAPAPEGLMSREAPASQSQARRTLGKGLSDLMRLQREPGAEAPRGGVAKVDIELVRPDDHQPRKRFDEAALEELASSIRHQGLLQ